MLLHDSSFSSANGSRNATYHSPITVAHSPLFHSTLTLVLSIFGACANFLCIIKLWLIISQYQQRKLSKNEQKQLRSVHILSHQKYRFLLILTSNNFLLCLSSIISCLDEKYFFQSLIARYHSCSFHILVWKFTLHFVPLLTIFILFRYHHILNKKFPVKIFNTSTFNQLLCTDLCILIPFVLALAWSVDGLWLWGATNIQNFDIPTIINNELNQTNEIVSTTPMNKSPDQSNIKLEEYYDESLYSSEQRIICYFQTNNDLNFTARLVRLIEADFLLLFSLHLIGLFLEILLHIRLSCCLIARKITPTFLREQQLSLYILYIFLCLTLTSLPFYFHRSVEILFYSYLSSNYHDWIDSRTLAQLLLFGISFKPILYVILSCPSNILFKFKCYTSIKIEKYDEIDDISLSIQSNQQQKHRILRSQSDRFSLRISSFYPKIHVKLRTLSNPVLPSHKHRSPRNLPSLDCNAELVNIAQV